MNDLEAHHQVGCLSHSRPRHPRVSESLAGLCFCFDDMEAPEVNLESLCSRAFTIGEERWADRSHL